MKDTEIKDRGVNLKRKIEELFLKLIIVSIYDMDKLKEKEMKKINPIKNTWYNLLINYLPEPIIKSAGCSKDQVISLFKTNTLKQKCMGDEKTKQTETTEKI